METIEISNKEKNGENIVLEGKISVLGVMKNDPERIRKIIIKDGIKYKNAEEVFNIAKSKNIEIEIASLEKIESFSSGKTHGGIIALASKRNFKSVRELFLSLNDNGNISNPFSIAILEGVEDPYNLGYAVRALYAQGVNALIMQERDIDFSEAVIERASTGTFSLMNIAVFGKSEENKRELLELLKGSGFTLYCIEKRKDAENVFDVRFANKTAFVIGGEKRGISKLFTDNADKFVKIPYNCGGFHYSLTAQTAATIIAYELHRQRLI